MRKIIFVLVLAFISSCSSEESGTINQDLNGEWFLIKVDCYCAFQETLDLKEFKLSFDDSENRVHIDNPSDSFFTIAETGPYSYDLEGNTIRLDGVDDSYKFEIKGTHLILTRIDDPLLADDELVLTYQKM